MDKLRQVAEEALNTFGAIADAATLRLQEKGISLGSLAVVNEATAEILAKAMRERNAQRVSDCLHLRREPTIARLVIADDDDREEVIYISPVGTVDTRDIKSCSYLSPKGRLAALRPGDCEEIHIPGGRRWFYVVEKVTFQPGEWSGEWDLRPAVEFREKDTPRTIKSLRELLRGGLVLEGEQDALAAWLGSDDEYDSGLIEDGIVKETLTAMQLRVKQLLDRLSGQDPALAALCSNCGARPPGTGKTTTMIKRLRRTVDVRHLDEAEREVVLEPSESGLDHPVNWIMFTPNELLRLQLRMPSVIKAFLSTTNASTRGMIIAEIAKRPLSCLRALPAWTGAQSRCECPAGRHLDQPDRLVRGL
jgi:hypothetical protein